MNRARLGVVLLAITLAVAPFPPSAVERQFSNRVYPLVQSVLTGFSNLVPFALFDVLLLGVIAWWMWRLVRDISGRFEKGWARVLGLLIWRTITIAAVLYAVFLFAWGFNYRRAPLSDRLAASGQELTPDLARQLVLNAVRELNALYGSAHAAITADDVPVRGDGSLAGAFARVQQALDIRTPARIGRPKRSLLDPYFTSAGVSGMTDPYFLETLVASDLLPTERPFVIAHEWSHLAGFADEGEANFLGWLTCVRGAPLDQYSGWLFLYSEALPGLARPDRTDAAGRLDAGPRDDLRAIADRVRLHVRPSVSHTGWQIYDRYLKANRVDAGAASYQEVIRLVLQTRFDAQWTPLLK